MRGLSLVAASRGHSSLRCAGPSLAWPLLLRSTGSRRAGSVVVAHRPSCSTACGILPDQGSNPCPLHRQADSQPLRHQGSPKLSFYVRKCEASGGVLPIGKRQVVKAWWASQKTHWHGVSLTFCGPWFLSIKWRVVIQSNIAYISHINVSSYMSFLFLSFLTYYFSVVSDSWSFIIILYSAPSFLLPQICSDQSQACISNTPCWFLPFFPPL